mmetsp:Transcript_18373/g.35106  ORF Transcript_18373/g.35106 Transcript_18373/m.35106 type:complete len:84 (+) Transcript_18373:1046-1297(+)
MTTLLDLSLAHSAAHDAITGMVTMVIAMMATIENNNNKKKKKENNGATASTSTRKRKMFLQRVRMRKMRLQWWMSREKMDWNY